MTTDNEYVLKGIKPTLPIVCLQGASSKIIPKEKDFIKANKASFGSVIGTITNYATSMYNVISNFEEGTPEYNELLYRLMCMQDYQQAEIDKAKGCLARPVLKEWYDFKVNKITSNDTEEQITEKRFNLSILANKKPYFFIYNYDKLKSEFMEYYKPNNQTCRIKYGMEIHELYNKQNKTEKEEEFLRNYEYGCPVNVTPCLCNKIAWMVEEHFRDVSLLYKSEPFDCELLKNPNVRYNVDTYLKIEEIKKEFDKTVKISNIFDSDMTSYEIETLKKTRAEDFRQKCLSVTPNEDVLCNILVDLCYNTTKSKQFAWDLCGNIMIRNLLKHNNYTLQFPLQSEDGDFAYKGLTFKMEVVELEIDSE